MSTRSQQSIVVLLLVAVAAATVGTGAFSAITAERTATIDMTSDAAAYLGMAPHAGPNGAYADVDGDGLVRLRLSKDNPNLGSGIAGGTGVPGEAFTRIDAILNLTNQGTQAVEVWITEESEPVRFATRTDDHGPIDAESNAITLPPGRTIEVGLLVDTDDLAGNQTLLESATVHAVGTGVAGPVASPSVYSETLRRNQTIDGQRLSFTFSDVPTNPVDNVSLTVTVNGDYNTPKTEYATVSVEGIQKGRIAWGADSALCTNITETYTVDASAVQDGNLSVDVRNSAAVDSGLRCQPFAETTVSYEYHPDGGS